MNDTLNYINAEGLKFFGKVNAGISHELKNILAIISETSGFLNDLTDLAKQGNDLKLSLLESCNDSIAEEIQRGFSTIKQMNKFAHSVDEPVRDIDLVETVNLAVTLSGFLSTSARVQQVQANESAPTVRTCPFLLQDLIYQILCAAYESTGPGGSLIIEVVPGQKKNVHLIFSSSVPLNKEEFPSVKIQKAVDILGIRFNAILSPLKIDLLIPAVSEQVSLLEKELQDSSPQRCKKHEGSRFKAPRLQL